MSGDLGDISGAVGDVGLGAAVAKSVEPDADGPNADGPATDSTGHTVEDACLNCGTPLIGNHCHSCGQKAKVHRTLRAFMNDLLHGVLHFEGKFWRTLPLLAWRPGKLMREYINGKRARYVSPIALFLFTVFVSFAIFSASGGFGEIKPNVLNATTEDLQSNLVEADTAIAEMNQRLVKAELSLEDKTELREDIRGAMAERDLLEKLVEASQAKDASASVFSPTITLDDGTSTGDGEASETRAEEGADSTPTGAAGVENWLEEAWAKAKSNPGLLLYKLQTNAYKLSWLLIPLSLPFVWLLFPFSRKFRMYDHTVFVTYSISFMTMLVVIASVAAAWQFEPLIIAPLVYAPFHLYRSLRGAYDLSRFGALWRTAVLSGFIWIALILFSLIMVSLVTTG